MEARAHSRFYRVLLKLLGVHAATGNWGHSVLLALLYFGYVYVGFGYVGFRYGQAVFILIATGS